MQPGGKSVATKWWVPCKTKIKFLNMLCGHLSSHEKRQWSGSPSLLCWMLKVHDFMDLFVLHKWKVCINLGLLSYALSPWLWTNPFGFASSKFGCLVQSWCLVPKLLLPTLFFWKDSVFYQISFCQGTAIPLAMLLMRYLAFPKREACSH